MASEPGRPFTTDHLGAAGDPRDTRAAATARARAPPAAARARQGTRAREDVMSDPPLVPRPLYGLRTWSVVGDAGASGSQGRSRRPTWPTAAHGSRPRARLGHASPAPTAHCGVHAWHPRPRWARRGLRRPGGCPRRRRGERGDRGARGRPGRKRARPYALVLAPGRNRGRSLGRLAAAYRVPVVEAGRLDADLDRCQARGLGLREPSSPSYSGRRPRSGGGSGAGGRAARRCGRPAGLAAVAVLLVLGLVATDRPGDRPPYGRTGEIHRARADSESTGSSARAAQ